MKKSTARKSSPVKVKPSETKVAAMPKDAKKSTEKKNEVAPLKKMEILSSVLSPPDKKKRTFNECQVLGDCPRDADGNVVPN